MYFQAVEKASFLILQFLNLVKNYGYRVSLIQITNNNFFDLNLRFLHLQQKLQDQRLQNMVNTRLPLLVYWMPQETHALQSIVRSQMLRQQQQQMQKMFTSLQLQLLPQVKAPLQQPPVLLQQQVLRRTTAYPQPMSPFQPAARQMSLATNYIYQNIASKYPLPAQQLYCQNVQNIYYNQSRVKQLINYFLRQRVCGGFILAMS